jgi:hypothetical protein
MEVIYASGTSLNLYQTTRLHVTVAWSRLMFCRYSVRISGGTPTVLMSVVFPQSFQANAWIVRRLDRNSFLGNHFEFVSHFIVRCYIVSILKPSIQIILKWSYIFWDITMFSPLKINWRFGGTSRLHLYGWRISQTAFHLLWRWFFAYLILRPWRRRRYVSPERRLTFNRLHGVRFQRL